MKRLFVLLFAGLLFAMTGEDCFAQKTAGLNNILPASPQATSIAQFYNYPVDYSTGIPDISIPVYDIKAGDIDLPIVLRYHPGSLKLNALSGWVGLGWSLTAEPTITRSVNGLADEKSYLRTYNPHFGSYSDNDYLYDITQYNSFDEQADNFYYSLGSKGSGEFVFKRPTSTQAVGTRQAILLPYESYQVSSSLDPSGTSLYSFKITDNDGTIYNFGGSQSTVETTETPGVMSELTAWKASSIISQKNDTVLFTYSSLPSNVYQNNFVYSYNESYTVEDDPAYTFYGGGALPCPNQGNVEYTVMQNFPIITKVANNRINKFSVSGQTYDPGINGNWLDFAVNNNCFPQDQTYSSGEGYHCDTKLLSTITFAGGRVEFSLNPNIPATLSAIKVYDNNNVLIKEIDFNISLFFPGYEQQSDPRSKIKLESLVIKNGTAAAETYGFQYISPGGYYGPYGVNTSFDYWGYYNGVNIGNVFGPTQTLFDALDLVPQQSVELTNYDSYTDYVTVGNGVRDVAANFMAWGLKEITYPAGGTTSFDFESNQYKDYTTDEIKYAGGYRIKSITADPKISGQPVITRTFKYGEDEDGVGFLRNVITPASFKRVQLKYYNGFYPIYNNEVQYIVDLNDVSTRVTTVSSNSINDLFYSDGSVVKYGYVTEYQNGGGNGKTVYQYDNSPTSINAIAPGALVPDFRDEWMGNNLLKKTEFKVSGTGYAPVHTTQYTYNFIQDPSFGYTDEGKVRSNGITGEVFDPVFVINWSFDRFFYQITPGAKRISSQIDTWFSDNNTSLTTETDYAYSNLKSLLPTTITNTNSKNQQTQKNIKYPDQFTGQGIYSDMVARNILTPVIEEDDYVNGNFTQSTTNSYIFYGNTLSRDIMSKKTVLVGGVYNSQKDLFEIQQYNRYGKPLLVRENDQFNAYLYDYRDQYPIAQIINSGNFAIGSPVIAATSFEADGNGNWTIPSSSRDNTGAVTGTQSYNLSNGACSLANLSPANTFIVSYWSRTGSVFSVTGSTSVKQGKTINGWTYFEHTVSGVSAVSVSGSGGIDELRLYPATAQMVTYAYQPLIGVTSQCDINNRVTYYEYDALGRLILIRDQDKNIIKKICYNYAGQAENCNP